MVGEVGPVGVGATLTFMVMVPVPPWPSVNATVRVSVLTAVLAPGLAALSRASWVGV